MLLLLVSVPGWRALFQVLALVRHKTQNSGPTPLPPLCYAEAFGVSLLEGLAVFYLWCGYLLVS